MIRRFLPVLVLAFVVGSLFRLGNLYDVAVLRMFGTQGIVVIGIWGAWIVRRLQVEAGVGRMEEALAGLLERGAARKVAQAGRHPVWLVDAPAGGVLLGVSEIAQSTRRAKAERLLARDAARVYEAAAQAGAISHEAGVRQGLVLVRKAVPSGVDEMVLPPAGRRVTLLNPEALAAWLGSADRSGV